MTYPSAGFGLPDAPLPFDAEFLALWLVLNVVVFVVLLGLTFRLATNCDGRALAIVADDEALRVDFRMAA